MTVLLILPRRRIYGPPTNWYVQADAVSNDAGQIRKTGLQKVPKARVLKVVVFEMVRGMDPIPVTLCVLRCRCSWRMCTQLKCLEQEEVNNVSWKAKW